MKEGCSHASINTVIYCIYIYIYIYIFFFFFFFFLTVILRGRARYELIYITNEAVGRVGYYQLISSSYPAKA